MKKMFNAKELIQISEFESVGSVKLDIIIDDKDVGIFKRTLGKLSKSIKIDFLNIEFYHAYQSGFLTSLEPRKVDIIFITAYLSNLVPKEVRQHQKMCEDYFKVKSLIPISIEKGQFLAYCD